MRINRALKFYIIYILISLLEHSASAARIENTTLFANKLTYEQEDKVFQAVGDVTLVSKEYTILADQIFYDAAKDLVFAKGNLLIMDRQGNIITGSEIILQDKFGRIILNDMAAKLTNQTSVITASRVGKFDDQTIEMDYVCYTACNTSEFKNPIWQIKAKHTSINQNKKTIEYRNVFFEVFGVPVIFLPYFSHPTPRAKAKSGLLAPFLDTKNLKMPIYFRAKSNLDLTITPRFADGQVITEGEIRHLTNHGGYQFNGSIANMEAVKKDHLGSVIKDQYLNQYHIFGDGNFRFDNITAGFNLRKASNPSYIRKYYDIYDPYLTSRIYDREVQGANYTQAEALYFQDMRSQKMFAKDLFVAPIIRTKRLYPLLDQGYLSIDSNQLFYKAGNQYQAWRSSNIFNLSKTFELQNHIFDVDLYNKIDLYKFNATIKDHTKAARQNTAFVKNIPEIHTHWRYPLITNSLLIIEPVALISSNLSKYHDKQILPIDSEPEFELDELNLVSPNRFSGRDNNETGDRISYGVNLQKINQTTYSLFLGKNHSKLNKNNTVGNISASNQNTEFYYRFNLSSKFNINMHELGTLYTIDKFDFSAILFKKNSRKHQELYSLKKISNLINKIRYNFNENWSANLDTVIDLSDDRATLIRGFGVTYQYDCVRISVRIFDNFTQDPNRNIKKSKNNISFKIGLKTLNM